MSLKNIKSYYGSKGEYLNEHADYFTDEQLEIDIKFISSVLKLNKKDTILDIACGNGRHTIALAKKSYNVSGVDFSSFLLNEARKLTKQADLNVNFYNCDIHKLKLPQKYDKAFLFFSEFGIFDGQKALQNISKYLKRGGLFLLDIDNIFRLVKYLQNHSESKYKFDFTKMELFEDKVKQTMRYYTVTELNQMFLKNKLKIVNVYGDYRKKKLGPNSRRIILVAKKF